MTSRITVPSSGASSSGASWGTSPSLLARVRAAEARAWDRFLALYGPLVLHWCRRARLQEHDAEDVFQDVFQAVLSGIGAFEKKREGDTLRGWLFTITRNKIRDHFRRALREPPGEGGTRALLRLGQIAAPGRTEEPFTSRAAEADDGAGGADGTRGPSDDGESSPEAAVRSAFFRRALDLIREDFQERTWNAFWRTAVEGRPTTDVAAELGMSAGAVRVARSRVLGRLRREIGEGL